MGNGPEFQVARWWRNQKVEYQLEMPGCPGCGKQTGLSGRVCSPECIALAGARILERQAIENQQREERERVLRQS